MRRWRDAMETALYGADGFFRRSAPADHFRTSALVGPIFTDALLAVVARVDEALHRPETLDVVDIGAGRGELLTALLTRAQPYLRDRLRPVAVEVGVRPDDLEPAIGWRASPPDAITGVLLATEWLDNVPLDIVEQDDADHPEADHHEADHHEAERSDKLTWRYVLVAPDGTESLGEIPDAADLAWLDEWWPDGIRAEIGRPRDAAWADAVSRVSRGLALTIDYGHLRHTRPPLGTLAAFQHGRSATPVPDGSVDLTAHIAADAVERAGSAVAGSPAIRVRQAEALRDLGVSGRRPELALARRDPAGYIRALASASVAAELTDPAGLGGHFWIYQPVGLDLAALRIAA